jgi:transposase
LIGCGRQAPCSEAGGYLFANARATRVKLLAHDGFGVRCAARRLNTGHFMCPGMTGDSGATLTLTQQQFDALVVGLPWQRLQQSQVVTRVQTLQWQRLIALRKMALYARCASPYGRRPARTRCGGRKPHRDPFAKASRGAETTRPRAPESLMQDSAQLGHAHVETRYSGPRSIVGHCPPIARNAHEAMRAIGEGNT